MLTFNLEGAQLCTKNKQNCTGLPQFSRQSSLLCLQSIQLQIQQGIIFGREPDLPEGNASGAGPRPQGGCLCPG